VSKLKHKKNLALIEYLDGIKYGTKAIHWPTFRNSFRRKKLDREKCKEILNQLINNGFLSYETKEHYSVVASSRTVCEGAFLGPSLDGRRLYFTNEQDARHYSNYFTKTNIVLCGSIGIGDLRVDLARVVKNE